MKDIVAYYEYASPDKLIVIPARTNMALIMCCKVCKVHNCTKFLPESQMAFLHPNSKDMAECKPVLKK